MFRLSKHDNRRAQRPDMIIIQEEAIVLSELTVGFEKTYQQEGSKRKTHKTLVNRLAIPYRNVVYANISMGARGFIENDSK